jgi:hypothetical protein
LEAKADGKAQEQCTALQFFSQFLMTGLQIMFVQSADAKNGNGNGL